MLLTVEAMTDEQGNVQLLEPTKLPSWRRVFVTVLDDTVVKPIELSGVPNVEPIRTVQELSNDWQMFFELLDEIAEEDDLIDPLSISITEEFLQSRR